MGALQDIPGPVPVRPIDESVDGARARRRHSSAASMGGTHAAWLTTAELRLIAEWLDIGGQYYNDPFIAPVN